MCSSHCETCSCLSASWWRAGLSPWQGSWTGRRSWLHQPPGRRRICCPRCGLQRGTEGFSGELPAEPPLGDTRGVDGCLSLLYWVKFPYIDNQLITPTVLSWGPLLLDKNLQLCLPLCHLTLFPLCFLPILINQCGHNATTHLIKAFNCQAETEKHISAEWKWYFTAY